MVAGNKGFTLSSRPKKYKELPQQKMFREAAEACNIKKGIKREELVKAMKECVPEYYRKLREGENV